MALRTRQMKAVMAYGALLLLLSPSFAADARFSLVQTESGFTLINNETGTTTACVEAGDGFSCRAFSLPEQAVDAVRTGSIDSADDATRQAQPVATDSETASDGTASSIGARARAWVDKLFKAETVDHLMATGREALDRLFVLVDELKGDLGKEV